jgi:endo-1,3-1,4-beta-glycanase ExoK
MERVRLVGVTALAVLGVVGTVAAGHGASGVSFFDDFSDAPLERKRWLVSDGWSNGSYQNCMWKAGNVDITGQIVQLAITPAATGKEKPFHCAEVQTHDFYGYGTYEVRMRPARASGTVSGFFVYTGPPHDNNHDEIDIEFPGARPRTVELNNWVDGVDAVDDTAVGLDFDASKAMNDYAFEWRPDAIRWYVNGELVREVTDPKRIPHTPGKIYMSLFNAAPSLHDWLGPFALAGDSLRTEVELVAYTRAGEPCQFPQSIVCGRDRR